MCGASQVAASVNLDDVVKPTGVNVTKDTDATQPTLTIAVTTAVTAGGVVDIPVQLDKPTAKPPGGNWVTAEPSYTSGSTNSLYFCDLNVFSDGSFAYSDVSLSSSYEAASPNAMCIRMAGIPRRTINTEVLSRHSSCTAAEEAPAGI